MTHYRGIRAQRQAAPRNADLPSEDDDPLDFPDTEFQDVGDAYHQAPGIPDHPIHSGPRSPVTSAQQENEPWHS